MTFTSPLLYGEVARFLPRSRGFSGIPRRPHKCSVKRRLPGQEKGGRLGPFELREFPSAPGIYEKDFICTTKLFVHKECVNLCLGLLFLFGKWGGGLGNKRLDGFKQGSTEIISCVCT